MDKILNEVDIHLESRSKSRSFFAFIWLMYSAVYMTKNSFNSAMASIVAEGILTKSQTGLISACFFTVYAPFQIVGGMLVDRYSPEKLIKLSLIGTALINLFIFFNHGYYMILAAWTLNAVIQMPVWPAVFKIISSQLVRSDRKGMVFLISFPNSFGLILGYVMAAFIKSWEYNFLASAIILLVLACVLDVYCLKLDTYMKPDKKDDKIKLEADGKTNLSAWKIFAASGFLFFLPGILIRTMIENGVKLMAPVMLMESYVNISAKTGNLLNLFIIISGILGVLAAKILIYPKLMKNEITAFFAMMILSVPFAVVLTSIGKTPASLIIVSMCAISALVSATTLFTSYYTMRFVPFGKSGVAAGTINAAASVGAILQSYGFAYIADNFNWNTLTVIWIIMLAVGAMFILPAAVLLKKYLKTV